jgi:hypothetical protein
MSVHELQHKAEAQVKAIRFAFESAFLCALGLARPLPACPAGEAVRRLAGAVLYHRPLPARPAGEGVHRLAAWLLELLHLPDEPAGVGANSGERF